MARVIAFRRFLVFQLFLLWQGGFVFYALIVVPTGTQIVGSPAQGLITQRVTHWLNVLGILWHLILIWEIRVHRDQFRLRLWSVSCALLIALMVIHTFMDNRISNVDSTFKLLHISYLWISTLHWVLALSMAHRTLKEWCRP